ncbi:flagellar hook-length control protein FliK [Lacimicrobium alkaliphilum]|uniref:Flagellar hook-length control protein-like C-terminal domain-containing protein n=1 Tax=Lacimicrobium alkaliphilum TaxID=1526571 RepID=A0A0U3AM42_9ALTE|nr:flagellar hook-length control protein FliK [Lacimicrobium alkaliphilum]ALS99042.1 hypothetical protein AT746_12725 [Lacimicrobium alkaliphilum]
MSDILLSSQQQLASALQQLQSAGSSLPSGLSQQASQAIVRHLSGNQLLLQTQKGELQLPGRTLQGELSSGQSYTLSLDPKNSSRLIFSSPPALVPAGRTDTGTITLTQLIPKALAELLLAQTLTDSGTALSDKLLASVKTQNGGLTMPASVLSSQANRLILQMADTQVQVQLPKPPPEFSKGQIVQLQYQKSGEWTLNAAPKSTNAPPSQSAIKVTLPANQPSPLALILPKNNPITLTQGSAELLQRTPAPALQPLMPLINQLRTTADAATLVVKDSGKVSLNLTLSNPAIKASIDLSSANKQQLQQLLPPLTGHKSSPAAENILTRAESTAQSLPLPQQSAGIVSSAVPKAPAEGISYQSLQVLLRRLHSIQESPAQSLGRIEQALKDSTIGQSESAKVIQQITQQLGQSLPKGSEQDATQLRALLSQPAMALTPLSLTTNTNQQGFLGGLITLLQLSLAARQTRNQPSQGERLAERLSGMLENLTGGNRVSPRGLADFAQAEQRHQLIRNLNLLLASHTAHKAGSAESLLQGQDSFYYSLPIGPDSNRKDIELLIRREPPPEEKNKQQQGPNKQWHLTMKLEIGEQGGLLAKARLYETQLELDFYAANDRLKDQVIAFLPLLKKRFQELGIDISHSQCQLGKIPQHLKQRPYQVFETQA